MKKENPDKIGIGKFWAWQSRGASGAINFIVVSFVAVYCSDALGMPPALVGTLLAMSSIVDAITDLFAGYLVDKTNTRWGKGRPYEWAILAEWILTFLMFSIPSTATLFVKAAWLLVCRILINSVCTTLLSASQNPYMIRAFGTNQQRIKLASFGGIVIMSASLLINIIFPILMANIATTPAGWSKMILLIALPSGVIGMMRFFFVKETVEVKDASETEEVRFSDVLKLLKCNPYVWIVGFMYFGYMLVSGMGINTYYFKWIVGDVKKLSIFSGLAVFVLPLLMVFPALMKKISKGRMVQLGCIAYIISGIIYFFFGHNFTILLVGGILGGIAALPITYLTDLMMLDCGTYNAHISGKRMDGTIGAVKGFLGKVGGALGLGLVGWLLQLGNYDGTMSTQPDSAIFMIKFLIGCVPIITFAIVALLMIVYKVDELLPEIEKEQNIV